MPTKHCVAFAASCAERLQQNYKAFALMEKWGSAEHLYSILDSVWASLEMPSLDRKHLEELIQACMDLCPDTEDFPSMYGSLALHAGEAVYCTLTSYLNEDVQSAVFASRAAFESLDVYLHVVNCPQVGVHSHDPDFDIWVTQTPLMAAEAAKQQYDLDTLKSNSELSSSLLREMRVSSANMGLQLLRRGIIRQ